MAVRTDFSFLFFFFLFFSFIRNARGEIVSYSRWTVHERIETIANVRIEIHVEMV